MTAQLANNATSRLANSISSAETAISVLPGDGAKFPTLTPGDWFPVTLVKANGELEICRCTARALDTLTIERAQEGTAPVAFSAGDRVELRLTRDALIGAFGSAAHADLADLLAKAGNLNGLADKAQARLNLGVIQTLAGEVFNTDNCTIINNSYGTAWRFPNGMQICAVEQVFDLPGDSAWKTAGTGAYRELGSLGTYPATFVSSPLMISVSGVDGATNRGGYITYLGGRLTTHIGPGSIVRSPEPPGLGGSFVIYIGLIGKWK